MVALFYPDKNVKRHCRYQTLHNTTEAVVVIEKPRMLVNYAFFDYRLDAEKYRDLVYQNNHEKINCFVISATNYIEHDMKLWYVETPNSKFAVCWVFTKAIKIRRPFFEFYDVESSAAMALKLIKDEDKLKLDKVACVVSIEEYKMYNPPMHSLW